MELKWNANGTQTSGRAKTVKRGVFPLFCAEEQKDREHAIKTIVFSERDDGGGRDGLFESGERRERPSRRRWKEGVTVFGMTITPLKTSSPSSRPSRPTRLTAVSGQSAVR